MSLIETTETPLFNEAEIEPGWVMCAKHESWDSYKAGFISSVTPEALVVAFHPPIKNIVNHFVIKSTEAARGEWTIRYSPDLETIYEYNPEAADES